MPQNFRDSEIYICISSRQLLLLTGSRWALVLASSHVWRVTVRCDMSETVRYISASAADSYCYWLVNRNHRECRVISFLTSANHSFMKTINQLKSNVSTWQDIVQQCMMRSFESFILVTSQNDDATSAVSIGTKHEISQSTVIGWQSRRSFQGH